MVVFCPTYQPETSIVGMRTFLYRILFLFSWCLMLTSTNFPYEHGCCECWSQVLERKNTTGEAIAVDHLSEVLLYFLFVSPALLWCLPLFLHKWFRVMDKGSPINVLFLGMAHRHTNFEKLQQGLKLPFIRIVLPAVDHPGVSQLGSLKHLGYFWMCEILGRNGNWLPIINFLANQYLK